MTKKQAISNISFICNRYESILVDDFFPETVEGSNLTESTLSYQLVTGRADIAIGLLYNILFRLKFGIPLMTSGLEPHV